MSEKLLATWRLPSFVALATTAAIWTALPTTANAADAAAGKQLFQDKTCSACHSIGQGPLVGPDLKGVTAKRPHDWLVQWIMAPDAVLAKKDEYAVKLLHEYHDVQMPNLGLSQAEAENLLAYLETTGAGGGAAESSAPAKEAASAPAPAGNADTGKDLFTGVQRFANGGPPCMACHSTGGIGALGGGQLGPDLTTVATRFGGAAGVNGFIAGLPTPTMKAVWTPHPLTSEERANVVSFLAGQAGLSQRAAADVWQLAGLTALGTVVLLLIAGFWWQNRLKYGVRRPMMATPTTGNSGPYHGGWFAGPYADGWIGRFKSGEKYKPRGTRTPRRH